MSKSLITEPLGLFGWSHLEPILLAALASKYPMLLVGKHGCAKSFILERLAEALKLEYRCYNASLINYDDLVGIPIPVNNNTSLSYISNSSSIWDAEVVFIDEINRTKVELQNKLFPIIYEKRVQGISLDKLQYRWAAMNPPNNNLDEDDYFEDYLGVTPLDPALIDRFPFIVEVPTWENLSEKEKRSVLLDNHLGRHEFPVNIFELIEKTKTFYEEILENNENEISKYIIVLMDLLANSFGYFSTRRATMLESSLIYVYAAQRVLNEYFNTETSFTDVAYLHIQNTIPNIASNTCDKTKLLNICREALELTKLDDSFSKKLVLTKEPVKKLKILIKNKNNTDISIINDTITSSLNNIKDEKIRRAMALFTYLSFRDNNQIYATVMETLANEIRPILSVSKYSEFLVLRCKKNADTVVSLMNSVDNNEKYKKYLNNYLCSYLPDSYKDIDEIKYIFDFFIKTYKELNL